MTVLRLLDPATPLPQVQQTIAGTFDGGRPVAVLPADAVETERVIAMLQPEVAVAEADAAVIVSTSGSTGQPKGVVLSRAAIVASADATHRRLGGPGHWLLALPTHYVAGFMVVARATVADMPVDQVGADLSQLTAALDRVEDRSYLSLVPTQLTRALDDPALTDALGGVSAILLGGAPARPQLLERARAAGLTVYTTYGMSETCGGCVYDGTALPGVSIAIADPDVDGAGRIELSGPMAFSGYRLRPELTAATLIPSPTSPPAPATTSTLVSASAPTPESAIGGTVRTNDRGRLLDHRLAVLGRFDDVIISGGLKIDLAAVERAARQWPALGSGEIVLLGVPDPEWGTRLIACAEDGGGVRVDLPALQDFLSGRVARHERPRELIMMPALPRTSSGKVDRQRLLADLSTGHSA